MASVDASSIELLERWRAGDPDAETELFRRYTARLVALARRRLSKKIAVRVDPEDVVQSAYRSFVNAVREDRFIVERPGDLWRLLASLTLHKALHQVRRHRSLKRSVNREEECALDDNGRATIPRAMLAKSPTASDAAVAVEELERALRKLSPAHRLIVELRLQGSHVREIADHVGRSERLIRKVLEELRASLSDQLCANNT